MSKAEDERLVREATLGVVWEEVQGERQVPVDMEALADAHGRLADACVAAGVIASRPDVREALENMEKVSKALNDGQQAYVRSGRAEMLPSIKEAMVTWVRMIVYCGNLMAAALDEAAETRG